MPSPTTRNRIEQQDQGSNTGTWGGVINTDYQLVDDALDGIATIAVVAGANALTAADYATDQSRMRTLLLTGALTAPASIILPAAQKWYWIVNNTTGGQPVTVFTSAAGSTGVTLPASATCAVISDGTGVSFLLDGSGAPEQIHPVAAPYTATVTDLGSLFTVSAGTLTLPSASAAGVGWWCSVKALAATSVHVSGADLIDGHATATLQMLDSCRLYSTGAGWALAFATPTVTVP